MADYEAKIAPFINHIFYVTQAWWSGDPPHRGLDIATATSEGNVELYSMCNGSIIRNVSNDPSYGNYIIMKSKDNGYGFLYAHLKNPSPLAVGATVEIGTVVGLEGSTGTSTGIHLHLEMQDLSNRDWTFERVKENYLDPAQFMGIPNQKGISVIYNGNPKPPITKSRNSTKWLLAKCKKIRIFT